MTELGAPTEYAAVICDRGGVSPIGDVLPAARLQWGRLLDDTSQAQVEIDLAAHPSVCEALTGLRTWRHELVIYRDAVRVWEGPLTQISGGRDSATLQARDVSVWLSRRLIREAMCWSTECGGAAADLGDIARALVQHAFGPDDPNVLTYLQMRPAGMYGSRVYEGWVSYVLDELNDLARFGIDWTVLGRRILSGDPRTFGQLPTLTCDDFAGDLRIIEDGMTAATRGVLLGGVPTTATDDDPDPVVGLAGGVDPYYGLIEQLAKEDTFLDQPSADGAARAQLANPPPLSVEVPGGSELSAAAPVGINELVPGALAPVELDCSCRAVSTTLRLAKVDVDYGPDGESVGVTLVPPVPEV